jgi:hypothetical protein
MSDTPKTDAVWRAIYPLDQETDYRLERSLSFARQLERELNAALRESEEQARLLGKGGSREAALLARIAELEKDKARLFWASELLLAGYKGLGGDMENNGPRLLNQTISAMRGSQP